MSLDVYFKKNIDFVSSAVRLEKGTTVGPYVWMDEIMDFDGGIYRPAGLLSLPMSVTHELPDEVPYSAFTVFSDQYFSGFPVRISEQGGRESHNSYDWFHEGRGFMIQSGPQDHPLLSIRNLVLKYFRLRKYVLADEFEKYLDEGEQFPVSFDGDIGEAKRKIIGCYKDNTD